MKFINLFKASADCHQGVPQENEAHMLDFKKDIFPLALSVDSFIKW